MKIVLKCQQFYSSVKRKVFVSTTMSRSVFNFFKLLILAINSWQFKTDIRVSTCGLCVIKMYVSFHKMKKKSIPPKCIL